MNVIIRHFFAEEAILALKNMHNIENRVKRIETRNVALESTENRRILIKKILFTR